MLEADVSPAVPAGKPPLKHGVLRIANAKRPIDVVAYEVKKVSNKIAVSGIKRKMKPWNHCAELRGGETDG